MNIHQLNHGGVERPGISRRNISIGEIPVLGQPGTLLRIEGFVLLAGALLLYAQNRGEWLAFLALLLVPDLSMVGYLVGPAIGAATYNLFHNYLLPATLAAVGVLSGDQLLLLLALIWFAHIGMDRLLGYGLKYSTGFKDTHISGPRRPQDGSSLDRTPKHHPTISNAAGT